MHGRSFPLRLATLMLAVLIFASACRPIGVSTTLSPTTRPGSPTPDSCPGSLSQVPNCFTPHALRVAYGVQALTEQGMTGKGQTVVDIVSYGSPTLQQDMDVFDRQFGLPAIQIQVAAPLGTLPFDPGNKEMTGWAEETELDVQIIHAIAPDAAIVVLTSPVDETEGTIGLPEFMKLEQYAVDHHLGQIFSQSWDASEATLTDSAGRQEVQTYTDFYHQITTQQGITVLSASGDNGATDYIDLGATKLAPTQTVGFPADVPWVTAVGGTSLARSGAQVLETAWPGSGGGASKFFAQPDFQRSLPASAQAQIGGQRGMPDVAADADQFSGLALYIAGQWRQIGGTSASTPLWAGVMAVANQLAGHPLGFINPGLYKLGTASSAPQDFRDITSGDNTVSEGDVHVNGFQAGPGWDAVTGWGAPQASQLLPDLIAALK